MSVVSITVSYRPVRIGFLVREGEIDDIVKVCGINTLLWGGIYNPIIPVNENDNMTRHFINLFCVDMLFPIGNSNNIKKIIEEYHYLKIHRSKATKIFFEVGQSKKLCPWYLDVIHIIDYYWREEFRHSDRSNCSYVNWSNNDDYKTLFVLMFGKYPSDMKLKYNYPNAFKKGLKAQEINISENSIVPSDLSNKVTPIRLTGHRLSRQIPYSVREDGIFLGNQESFTDLVAFWNLRASGVNVVFLPIDGGKRLIEYFIKYVAALDQKPMNSLFGEEGIGIYYRKSDKKEFEKVLSFLKPKKKFIFCHAYNINPQFYHFNPKEVMAICEKKNDRYTISVPLPERIFFNDRRPEQRMQTYVIQLDSLGEYEYPGFTLKVPFLPDLNKFYGRQIYFPPSELRVEKDCISLINDSHTNILHLTPLSISDLIIKLFERAEIQAQLSQAGLLAKQIITNMGDIEGCRVFKIRGVRKLLEDLSDEISWGRATKTIWEEDFANFQDLFIEPRKKAKLDSNDVWKFLIAKQIFIPVSKFLYKCYNEIFNRKKRFVCKKCGLGTEIHVKKFQHSWKCIYCGHIHYLPLFIKDCLVNEMRWWGFKKSDLFTKGIKQEGSIPVILTLMQLNRLVGDGLRELKWCTSLQLEYEEGKCEVDFAMLSQGTRSDFDRLVITIGECKGNMEISDDDINHLCAIKEKLENSGIACFFAFSKTAKAFLPSEIERLKKIVKEKDIWPILFTRQELEPYEPYWYHEKESTLPHKYAHDMQDIAENSVHIYLSE